MIRNEKLIPIGARFGSWFLFGLILHKINIVVVEYSSMSDFMNPVSVGSLIIAIFSGLSGVTGAGLVAAAGWYAGYKASEFVSNRYKSGNKTIRNEKLVPVGVRFGGWFLFGFILYAIGIMVIEYSSMSNFINQVPGSITILLPVILLMITTCYSFNNENFIFHFFCYKKIIPLYKIIEVRYFTFGTFKLTIYREVLNETGYIFIMLLCSKKRSLKMMEDFFYVLSKKNHGCSIYL